MANPENTIVLVTGASSGIGLACAEYLAGKKYKVYGTSRNPDKNKGVGFQMIGMDANQSDSVTEAIESVVKDAGKIDVVVNNAGCAIMGAVEDTSVEEAAAIFETNVFGVMRVCQAVLPVMRKQNSGKIINVSSIGGFMGLPFRGIYCASKFALEGLSESLRMEVDPFGIKVSIIEPGDMKTSINENRKTAEKALKGSVYSEAFGISKELINEGVANGQEPIVIGKAVERVILSDNPPLRIPVGFAIQKLSVSAKKHLPERWFEWIIKKHYKLT